MSSNHTRIKLTPRHRANSSLNDTNSSVKVQNSSLYDINSSFSSSIANMSAKSEGFTKYRLKPRNKKNDVTAEVTHFSTFNNSESQCFTSDDNKRYYRVLSNSNSGHASRHPLAFFVPNNGVDSQTHSNYSSTAPKAHLSASRAQTLIFMAAPQCLPNDYDGMTLQNKIAFFGRICRAVSVRTESKSRHPIPITYSVAPTQNLTGGYHA